MHLVSHIIILMPSSTEDWSYLLPYLTLRFPVLLLLHPTHTHTHTHTHTLSLSLSLPPLPFLPLTPDGIAQNRSIIMHMLSQARVGMDLTRITLPTFILEKRSLLEMYAEFFAHPDLFAS